MKTISFTSILAIGTTLASLIPILQAQENESTTGTLDVQTMTLESVEIRSIAGGSDEAIAIPRSSIIHDGGRPFVYLQDEADETNFILSPVTLGTGDDFYVDALTGVFPGDKLATDVAEQIAGSRTSAPVEPSEVAVSQEHVKTSDQRGFVCDFERGIERSGDERRSSFRCRYDRNNPVEYRVYR